MPKSPYTYLKYVNWRTADPKGASLGALATCHISSGHNTNERNGNGLGYKYGANNINLRLMSSKSNSNGNSSNPTVFSRKVAKTGIRASAITLHSRSSSSSSVGKVSASVVKGNQPLSSSSSSLSSSARNTSAQDENVSSKKSRIGPGPSRSSSTVATSSTASGTHATHSSMSNAATAYWVATNSRPHSPVSMPSANNRTDYTRRDSVAYNADQRERDALFSILTINVPDAHVSTTSSSNIANHKKQTFSTSTSTENFPYFGDTDITGTGTIKARPSGSKKRKAVNMPLPIPFPTMEGSSGAGVKTSDVLVQASPASSPSPFSLSTKNNRATAATTKAIMKDGSAFTVVAEAQTPSPIAVPTILARYIPPLTFDKHNDIFNDQSIPHGKIIALANTSLPLSDASSPPSSMKGKLGQSQSKIPRRADFSSHGETQRGYTLKIRPLEKHVEFWDFSDNDVFLWHGSLLLTHLGYQQSSFDQAGSQIPYLSGLAPEILGLDIRCKSVARQGRHARENPEKPVFFARYMGEMDKVLNTRDKAKGAATANEANNASQPVIPDPLSDAPELSVKISSWATSSVDSVSSLNATVGWVLPFTIPIPTRHFVKMESRQFRLKAAVKVKVQHIGKNAGADAPDMTSSKDEFEDVEPKIVVGDKNGMTGEGTENIEDNCEIIIVSRPIEVTVSHLRRGREMLNFHYSIGERSGSDSTTGKKKASKLMREVEILEYESGDECSDDEFALA